MEKEVDKTVLASGEFPYVLFNVDTNTCGVSCSKMLSIQILDTCTPIINSPDYVRGCTNFRGTFIPLVDIRKMTGQEGQIHHLEEIINIPQRKKDHENWIDTLEKCIIEDTEFTLTEDPHACAFGRWVDGYETSNLFIKKLLQSIEEPHAAVHAAAKKARDFVAAGNKKGALAFIRDMRATVVLEVFRILDALDEKMHDEIKEMMVVVESAGGPKGLIVDHVVGVEMIDSFEPVPAHLSQSAHITCIGRQEKNQEPILIFDCDQIK